MKRRLKSSCVHASCESFLVVSDYQKARTEAFVHAEKKSHPEGIGWEIWSLRQQQKACSESECSSGVQLEKQRKLKTQIFLRSLNQNLVETIQNFAHHGRLEKT